MLKQSEKRAALYYRVASKQTDSLHLDNQMQTLLCYAKERGIDSFTLYADNGKSGANLNRPAFNALIADIEAGHIGLLIVRGISRIGRDYILTGQFIMWARSLGVEIYSVIDGVLPVPLHADITALFHAAMKGGGRV